MSSLPARLCKRKRSPDRGAQQKDRQAPNLVGPQTIVTVNVSSPEHEMQPFRVHKNYICYYSPYFEAAFNGSFIEGETQVLDLGDTDPAVFGIFVNWLYTQKVVNAEGKLPSCADSINLWILADKIIVPTLQNYALASLDLARVRRKHRGFTSQIFHRVWDNTAEDSPLRIYLVDVLVETKCGKLQSPENYPREMLVAIINGMRAKATECSSGTDRFWRPTAEKLEDYFVPDDSDIETL